MRFLAFADPFWGQNQLEVKSCHLKPAIIEIPTKPSSLSFEIMPEMT
jgi:hypothetical protein